MPGHRCTRAPLPWHSAPLYICSEGQDSTWQSHLSPSPPRTNSCSSLRFYLTPSLISSGSIPTLPTGPRVSTFTPNTALTYDLTLDGSSPPLKLVRTLCQL